MTLSELNAGKDRAVFNAVSLAFPLANVARSASGGSDVHQSGDMDEHSISRAPAYFRVKEEIPPSGFPPERTAGLSGVRRPGADGAQRQGQDGDPTRDVDPRRLLPPERRAGRRGPPGGGPRGCQASRQDR